jgi:misacylated tRNA(Ala) deacylase
MTEALYLEDSYLKEFTATITKVGDGKFIVLDKTAFYPSSGGQPEDHGTLTTETGEIYKIIFAKKFGQDISHEVDKQGLKEGDIVTGKLDWDRRYRLMKMHTASHIISAIFNKAAGAKITGNQLGLDKSRIDFNIEDFDRELFHKFISTANKAISQNIDIETSFLPREEAMKIPGVVKLAGALPPSIETLRIVKIGDVDEQADGGTHVKNTSEIGTIKLLKLENKGKSNRRAYFTIN